MQYKTSFVLTLATIAVFCLPSRSVEQIPDATRAVGDLPWHLADVWWHFPAATPSFESVSVDFELLDDLPAGSKVFVYPICGRLNGITFYAGARTNIPDVFDSRSKLSNDIGPGCVITMWTTMSLAAIRPALGGLYYAGNHEGEHVSSRVKYVWGKGRYTCRVVKLDRQVIGHEDYTWVGAFLENHSKKETVFIGATRFPGRELVLRDRFSAFVELYDFDLKRRPKVPEFRVAFGNLRINGEPAKPKVIGAEYPDGVPPVASVQHAAEYAADHKLPPGTIPTEKWSVVVDVGSKPIKRRGGPELVYPPDW